MLEFDDQVGAEDPCSSSASRRACAAAASSTGSLMGDSERLIAHFQGLLLDALA